MIMLDHIERLLAGVPKWNAWRSKTLTRIANPKILVSEDAAEVARGVADSFPEPEIKPDLSGCDFSGRDLSSANLAWCDLQNTNFANCNLRNCCFSNSNLTSANLIRANLENANFGKANLRGAALDYAELSNSCFHGAHLDSATLGRSDGTSVDFSHASMNKTALMGSYLHTPNFAEAKLRGAEFYESNLPHANFSEADLSGAEFIHARLHFANFFAACLRGADLTGAQIVSVDIRSADLSGCIVWGISAWNLVEDPDTQMSGVVITQSNEPKITVDDINVAQFLYMLLNNSKIRTAIDAITSKVVLLLGRFTPERKSTLDLLRTKLRSASLPYIPVMFDFEKPASRDYIETVSVLAHMARFVLVDITDAKIVLEEVPHIVRNVAVPVQPIVKQGVGGEPVTLFNLRRNHRSVLQTVEYADDADLIRRIESDIIGPAERMAASLETEVAT